MKILLISGFLGAGKTTFIKELIKHTDKEVAIFENELAESGVDRNRLLSEEANINVWEMTEGCVCCEAKGDFRASVLTIANSVDPEYLIIEPTGVAMPANILAELRTILYERISILSPVGIIDGIHFRKSRDLYPELFEAQAYGQRRIVVSKTEGLSGEEREDIIRELRTYAEKGEIYASPYKEQSEEWWRRIFSLDIDGNLEEISEDVKLPDTLSVGDAAVTSPEELILFLENMIRGCFGDIIRAKGCVEAGGIKLRFDSVNSRYAVTGAEINEECNAVFIGENIDRQAIREAMLKGRGTVRIRRRGRLVNYPRL